MAEGNKDMKMVGLLILGLLVLMILVGTTYVIGSQFKNTLCTTELSTNTWSNGECLLANGTAVSVESIEKTEIVEDAIAIVLSFLAIIVIVLIARVILKITRGFSG